MYQVFSVDASDSEELAAKIDRHLNMFPDIARPKIESINVVIDDNEKYRYRAIITLNWRGG